MGQTVTRTDFEWTPTEEPHATRRKIILEKYPQIKKLFGYDPRFKWIVFCVVLTQIVSLHFIKDFSWPMLLLVGYCFGGVINHNLALAVHEISHNLAFGPGRPLHNKLLGIFANLPLGFPMSVRFRVYHLEHHRYQGNELKDTDLPTYVEAKLFSTTFGKLIWVSLMPFFYSLRPLAVYPKPPLVMDALNAIVQFAFDGFVWYYFGGRMLVYLMASSFLGMGLHPTAAHFLSEHYMFKKGCETYSYYGPLNWLTWNIGYHNEHHDFPSVPGLMLPEVRKIAAEFYDPLPQHESWVGVLYDFITDPDLGLYTRIKRRNKERRS